MIIKEYDLIELQKGLFGNGWFGTSFSAEVMSNKLSAEMVMSGHDVKPNYINETDFECMIHLSVLEDMRDENITFMEVGAGFGAQAIRVFGAIKSTVVPTIVKNIECVCIEAEPTHYKWLCDTFKINGISGVNIYGAMSNKLGYFPFLSIQKPDEQYGGTLCRDSRSYEVPCFTIDYLFDRFGWSKLHYIDMDIQGSEIDVLYGGMKSIEAGKIDYIKIATHRKEFNQQIRDLMSSYYEVVIDILVGSNASTDYLMFDGFNKLVYMPIDGLMLLKRKDLFTAKDKKLVYTYNSYINIGVPKLPKVVG